MKFAHIADCHVGGWREPKLRQVNYDSFSKAIDEIIEEKVDFLLVAGDLFNTSFPAIDALKLVVQKFKKLEHVGIPVYFIAGSHDFSPSGKTMLDVIEEADLAKDVFRGGVVDEKLQLKFTVDEKTNAKITGIIGKRGMLDKKYYEELSRDNLENENGFKIFMFHTTIDELKPKELEKMEGSPVSFLPKNFDYYAGGHVHIVRNENIDGYKNVVYPGPIFPNNFSELEELGGGSYYIYEDGNLTLKKVIVKKHIGVKVDCKNSSPEKINDLILEEIGEDVKDSIITIRLKGKLDGRVSEINFKEIFDSLYGKGAYFIMKNTSAIKIEEFEEIKVSTDSVENIEDEIISENIGQSKLMESDKEKQMIKQLLSVLDAEKDEGEKVSDYEKRVKDDMDKLLELL